MKRGPIPGKNQSIILEPVLRLKMLDELEHIENELIKYKKILKEMSDDMLILYNECQCMRSKIRNLKFDGD